MFHNMVERHILVLTCACLAIVSTMVLAVWMSRDDPQMVPIGSLDQVELGTLVTVEGNVSELRHSPEGVSVLTLSDGLGEEVEAFCRFPCEGVGPGSRVRVTGKISLYRGDLELVVEEREDLIVLGTASNPMVEVEDLAREPWAYEGMEPRVRVVVLAEPVADSNGEDWWCLVGDGPSDGVGVLALAGQYHGVDEWDPGDAMDLRVTLRYDATSGFVYLEVLEVL
jgi:hypothetical protein